MRLIVAALGACQCPTGRRVPNSMNVARDYIRCRGWMCYRYHPNERCVVWRWTGDVGVSALLPHLEQAASEERLSSRDLKLFLIRFCTDWEKCPFNVFIKSARSNNESHWVCAYVLNLIMITFFYQSWKKHDKTIHFCYIFIIHKKIIAWNYRQTGHMH